MSDKRKQCAPVVGCVGLMVLLGLAVFVIWLVFKPNSTTVDQVSGKMIEKNNLIDLDPSVKLDLHGQSCWAIIGILATLLTLLLAAAAIYPKLKARRDRKKSQREELAMKLEAMEKEAEGQRSAAAEEIAALRAANNQRMQSLNAEVLRLRGETQTVMAHQSSRDRITP